jgi:RNA polymerase sigma factor (sigma-70 family)
MAVPLYDEFTPESLLFGLKNKDQLAWARVAKLYAPLIRHWCKNLGVSSSQDCDDVCQEVLVKVILHSGSFRARYPKGSLRGWLQRVTRHVVFDFFSNGKRMIPTDPGTMELILQSPIDDFDEPSVSDSAIKQLYVRAMEILEKNSKPNSWNVFRTLIETNDSYEKVAEHHNMTLGNVRIIKFRMLKRLKEIVELNDTYNTCDEV